MAEYIEREAAFDAVFEQFCASSDETEAALNAAIEEIRAIPAADVRPVVREKWVDDKGNPVPWDELNKNCPNHSAYCSVCGEWLTASDEYPATGNFCPNCGADMRDANDEKA